MWLICIVSLPAAASHCKGHMSSRAERGIWSEGGPDGVTFAPPGRPGPSLTLGVTCLHAQKTRIKIANRFIIIQDPTTNTARTIPTRADRFVVNSVSDRFGSR